MPIFRGDPNCPMFVEQPLAVWAVRAQNAQEWDNLWESRGGSMVNGSPREFPESNQCTP